jgi:hypothetical protein
VEEIYTHFDTLGESAAYEWQGRPPHERLPGHLARFRQLVCCVVSMSCIFLHDIRYHSVEESFNTKAYFTFIRWAISKMV